MHCTIKKFMKVIVINVKLDTRNIQKKLEKMIVTNVKWVQHLFQNEFINLKF